MTKMPPAFTDGETEPTLNADAKQLKMNSEDAPETKHFPKGKSVKNYDNKFSKEVHQNKCKETFTFGRRRGKFVPYQNNSFIKKQSIKSEKKKNLDEKFRYGNYHYYYGYRNQGSMDLRLACMKQEFFSGKDILDIGCNAGHFTLAIARDFSPKSIIGMDIDYELVKMAMKNVRHYITPQDVSSPTDDAFPISFVYSYGPVAQSADPRMGYPVGKFPFNVQFVQGNYVLPSDDLLDFQEAKFDTVLCLSLTKWIHLNWGDEGIKRLFHRIFINLHPGGHLILEAQVWESYAKKKNMTDETKKYYNGIKLFPEMFNEYLLNEVGFISCELIDTPAHSSKGFSRPIYLFTKGKDYEFYQEQPVAKRVIYDYSCSSNCKDSDVEELSD